MLKRLVVCAGVLVMLGMVLGSCASRRVKPSERAPVRGLYFNVVQAKDLPKMQAIMRQGLPLGVNTFVLDVQPYLGERMNLSLMRAEINPAVIKMLKDNGVFTVARVVCFQYGLKTIPAPAEYLRALDLVIENAGKAGFEEIQLDYIRFADERMPYSREEKYAYIGQVLARARAIADKYGAILTADVFGRIAYHPHDRIGQRLEEMAPFIDIVYPMLYPSHFTDSPHRMGNPGFTIREGVEKSAERLKGTKVRTIPWIQAFAYNLGYSRMNLTDYIAAQIEAGENASSKGWIAWNAHGRYDELFTALRTLIRAGKVAAPAGK
jgi:hypothetical protein